MAEIPAPLASRHTAVAVVVAALVGAVGSLVWLARPTDALVIVPLQFALAVAAAILAVAALVTWRTLARRSRYALDTPVAAVGGLALLAVLHVAALFVPVLPQLEGILLLVAAFAGVLVAGGLLATGAAVLIQGVWRGPTRLTPVVSGVLTIAVIAAFALDPDVAGPIVYAVWSLSFLGFSVGLRSRRTVANAGVQQGAAIS